MDGEELSRCVNKPCIVAQDECYNCEWSTELEVPQAFAEYVKAWFACHLIAREYGLGSPDGFVFNMSVAMTWRHQEPQGRRLHRGHEGRQRI